MNCFSENYDVAIIGAGLAGLQCARLLGKLGLRVALIDRKARVGQRVHTTGIFVRKTFEDYPFLNHYLGPTVRQIQLISPQGKSIELNSQQPEFKLGNMAQLYDFLWQSSLESGVHGYLQCHFLGSHFENGFSHLVAKGPKENLSLKARFLVGADGCFSRVARDLDLAINQKWIVGLEEVWKSPPSGSEPAFYCFMDSKLAPGYLGWLIEDGKETHLGLGGYPSKFKASEALDAFKSKLTRQLSIKIPHHLERRGGRIPVGGVLKALSNSRGLLIGDASGAVSPLTAGGLDPCLRLTEWAALTLFQAFQNKTIRDENPLANYHSGRFKSRFSSKKLMRNCFNRFSSNASLNLFIRLCKIPPIRQFAHRLFFGRGSFPDIEEVKISPLMQYRLC